MKKTLSIIVPVYNEADVLCEFHKRLSEAMEKIEGMGVAVSALFVNDGSFDKTQDILNDINNKDERLGFLRLSRNFGHQSAIRAGLDFVNSDAVIVMDADLQDPPEMLIQLLHPWIRNDADVIYAIRKSREGSIIKRFAYFVFYRFLNLISEVKIPTDCGDFALMDRCVYEQLKMLPESNMFLRGMRSWVGFRQCGIKYDRPERAGGKSKYGWKHLYKLATDGLASFSILPLQLAQVVAFIYACAGVAVILGFWFSQGDFRNTLVFLLYFAIPLLFFCIYILGAYVGRMYQEIKRRPAYIVAQVVKGKAKTL